MQLIPTIVATLALSASLAACSEEQPAVCGSVDNLEASVDDVQQIDVAAAADLTELQSGLAAIESDLADVKADAAAEFASQIDSVEASYDALVSSIESATTSVSADSLTAAQQCAGHVRYRRADARQRRPDDLLSPLRSPVRPTVDATGHCKAAVSRMTLSA